ncbi:MAG: hypothetical protein H7125_03005 [Proteobacteria bacterium]|nr:hypothetical protein [Burkholderiales bacterium]
MSRWFSKSVVIRVHLDRLERVSGDVMVRHALVTSANREGLNENAQALGEGLHGALTSGVGGPRSVDFELSTGLLRFEAIAWVEGVSSRDERLSLARARFETVYGGAARDWDVELAEAGYGRGGLAVAVHSDIPQTIAAACTRADLTVDAIRPMCEIGIDALMRRMRTPTAWLVIVEGAHAFVGLVHRGGWMCASTMAIQPDTFLDQLGDVLAREAMLVNVPVADGSVTDAPVLVYPGPDARVTGEAGGAVPAPYARLEAGGLQWALEWVASPPPRRAGLPFLKPSARAAR